MESLKALVHLFSCSPVTLLSTLSVWLYKLMSRLHSQQSLERIEQLLAQLEETDRLYDRVSGLYNEYLQRHEASLAGDLLQILEVDERKRQQEEQELRAAEERAREQRLGVEALLSFENSSVARTLSSVQVAEETRARQEREASLACFVPAAEQIGSFFVLQRSEQYLNNPSTKRNNVLVSLPSFADVSCLSDDALDYYLAMIADRSNGWRRASYDALEARVTLDSQQGRQPSIYDSVLRNYFDPSFDLIKGNIRNKRLNVVAVPLNYDKEVDRRTQQARLAAFKEAGFILIPWRGAAADAPQQQEQREQEQPLVLVIWDLLNNRLLYVDPLVSNNVTRFDPSDESAREVAVRYVERIKSNLDGAREHLYNYVYDRPLKKLHEPEYWIGRRDWSVENNKYNVSPGLEQTGLEFVSRNNSQKLLTRITFVANPIKDNIRRYLYESKQNCANAIALLSTYFVSRYSNVESLYDIDPLRPSPQNVVFTYDASLPGLDEWDAPEQAGSVFPRRAYMDIVSDADELGLLTENGQRLFALWNKCLADRKRQGQSK